MEMSAEEFDAMMRRLGFNQTTFAKHTGMHRNTVRRWCVGEIEVPGIAAAYLRLLSERRAK